MPRRRNTLHTSPSRGGPTTPLRSSSEAIAIDDGAASGWGSCVGTTALLLGRDAPHPARMRAPTSPQGGGMQRQSR